MAGNRWKFDELPEFHRSTAPIDRHAREIRVPIARPGCVFYITNKYHHRFVLTIVSVNVITIKWGDLYGSHYVNRLYAGVQRNLRSAFRFVCFTDNSQGIRPEVEVYPLPEINLEAAPHFTEGRKLGLFQSGIGDLDGPCLYFDLDIIIVGSIDCFSTTCRASFVSAANGCPPISAY